MRRAQGRRGRRTANMIRVANERIQVLFDLADREASAGNSDLADRYVGLARKIGMRYNIRIPRELNLRMCKYCHRHLRPGATAHVRTRNGRLVITCSHCGRCRRLPFRTYQRGTQIDSTPTRVD